MNNFENGNIKIYGYLEEWPIKFPIKIYADGKLIKKLKRRTTFDYKITADTILTFKFASFKKATLNVKADDNIDIFLSITTDFSYSVIANGIYRSDPEYLKVREIFLDKWHKSYIQEMKKDVKIYKLKKLLFIGVLLFSYYALFILNFYLVLFIHIIAIVGIIRYTRTTSARDEFLLVFKKEPDTWQPDERYYDWVKSVAQAISIKYGMKWPSYMITNFYEIRVDIFDPSYRIRYVLIFDNIRKIINEKNRRFPLYVEARIIGYSGRGEEKENYSRTIDIGEVDLSTLDGKKEALKIIEEAIFEGEVNKVHEYTIKYYVGVSSSNTTVETVTASSEYNAKQLIINKYNGQEVHILDIKMN